MRVVDAAGAADAAYDHGSPAGARLFSWLRGHRAHYDSTEVVVAKGQSRTD
eukprot:SAG31_NODE_101_length_25195_cov_67.436758_18_plen_51_part_00